jgi:signal peptidase I
MSHVNEEMSAFWPAPPSIALPASSPVQEVSTPAEGDVLVATKRDPKIREYLSWTYQFTVALGISLFLRAFVLATFFIPSESMVSTLNIEDKVIIEKISYRFTDIARQEIVVFHRPEKLPATKENDQLIKRVIGLPGDSISFKEGKVYVNDVMLEEPYLAAGMRTEPFLGFGTGGSGGDSEPTGKDRPIIVPAGHLFVMGDNRINSCDSRCFGTIDQKLVMGRARAVVWPFSRMTTL